VQVMHPPHKNLHLDHFEVVEAMGLEAVALMSHVMASHP
jgi:hypothetical protein